MTSARSSVVDRWFFGQILVSRSWLHVQVWRQAIVVLPANLSLRVCTIADRACIPDLLINSSLVIRSFHDECHNERLSYSLHSATVVDCSQLFPATSVTNSRQENNTPCYLPCFSYCTSVLVVVFEITQKVVDGSLLEREHKMLLNSWKRRFPPVHYQYGNELLSVCATCADDSSAFHAHADF